MNKKTLLLTILGALILLPLSAYAQTLGSMAAAAESAAFDACDAIVVILWLVTGVLFLLAQGAPEKANMAKKALMTSVIGTVVLILAYPAVHFVGGIFNIGS